MCIKDKIAYKLYSNKKIECILLKYKHSLDEVCKIINRISECNKKNRHL